MGMGRGRGRGREMQAWGASCFSSATILVSLRLLTSEFHDRLTT